MQFVALTVICHLGFCFAYTSQRNCVSAVRRLDALPQKTYILLILIYFLERNHCIIGPWQE